MGIIISESNEKPLFELKESTDDRIIYQRVIKQHGRSKNKVKRIVNNLPTATVHFFTEEDFEKLKEIEEKLTEQIVYYKVSRSLREALFKFLEI
jgi:hypothetical protein